MSRSGGDTPGVATVLVGTAAAALSGAVGTARWALRAAGSVPLVGGRLAEAIDAAVREGERALAVGIVTARAVLRVVVREVVAAALGQVDITAIVRDHVDVDAIVAQVDIDAIVRRLDLDAIVATVDIDGIIDTVDIGRILDRIDLDAVVARVDLDAAVARVDLDAAVHSLDLIALADEIMDGVDLPRIIRESTGSLTTEAVRGVRSQGMAADEAVSGFIGRLLGREPVPGDAGTGAGTGTAPAGAGAEEPLPAIPMPPAPEHGAQHGGTPAAGPRTAPEPPTAPAPGSRRRERRR